MSTLPSPSQQYGPNPTTPAFTDDTDWIKAYLEIHALSQASWRYAYMFWLAIGLVTLTSSVFHLLGYRTGRLGAYWTKWSLRRRTWRKKHSLAQARKSGQPHKQPLLLPSNAQLLSLISLITACLAATFLGPDHIAPANKFFGRWAARDLAAAYKPQYTIPKAWWTSGGRAGLMSFALFPLCVLFALKRPPFAIFAIPFLTRIHFDKFMWLHRWTGRFIWAMVTLHATLWSVQLVNDTRSGTGKMAYIYAWHFQRFICAWIAFILFTLLILLSSGPMREKHYDLFYVLHVILVPSTIVMSALHHPPLWWWCWLALLLWAGERTWRATKWVYVNGFLGSRAHCSTTSPGHRRLSSLGEDLEMRSATPDLESIDFSPDNELYAKKLHRDSLPPYRSPDSKHTRHHRFTSSTTSFMTFLPTFAIPIGYGHAEILAGRTIRLRIITPGEITWAPGQHFLICIPSVSRLVSHPFTCASVYDDQKLGDDGRMITFLIRAKNGWTKNLWTLVVSLLADGRQYPARESPGEIALPSSGVLLKVWVDGPFGSPERTNWGLYSSAVVICGGSGVSFGISVLEFLCLYMAGRNGRYLGGNVGKVSAMRRIRFIWILRDFAHMQWCASVLHRCRLLVPRESLQLDLFVTNFNPSVPLGYNDAESSPPPDTLDLTSSKVPPEGQGTGISLDEDEFIDDQNQDDDFVDLSYYTGEYNKTGEFGHEEDPLDLTNFDGENDDRLPGETTLNRKLKKEGTIRRALTRKTRVHRKGKHSSEDRTLYESRRSSDTPAYNAETSRLLDSPVQLPQNSLGPSADASARRHSSHRPASLSSVSIVPHTPPLGDWDTSGPRDRFADGSLDWERKTVSSAFSHASSHQPLVREAAKGVELEVGSQEMRDVNVMTEFARPGRPKIDSILKDEAGRTRGRVVVACCGPATLNAVVRKAVAAQINPARIGRGDYGGSIDLVVEDFSY